MFVDLNVLWNLIFFVVALQGKDIHLSCRLYVVHCPATEVNVNVLAKYDKSYQFGSIRIKGLLLDTFIFHLINPRRLKITKEYKGLESVFSGNDA